LTNCFILWRLQARKKDPKADWDPVEFNRALRDSLIIYDPSRECPRESDSATINISSQATEVCQAVTQNAEITEAPKKVKYAVIQREIPPQRIRGGLLGIPKRVEEVTNVQSIIHAHSHTLERVPETSAGSVLVAG
jgi:hypothetical protein